jgi:DNA-binding transcriptional LysR family regulator
MVRERMMQKLDKHWGTIVVGASTTIGNYFLPPVLARFKGKYPAVSTRILVDNTDQVLSCLSDGIVDFAIVEGPANSKRWITREASIDELVVIVPGGFPGGAKGTITAGELSRQPFIVRETGSGTRAVIDSLRIGNRPLISPANVVLELGSSTAIKRTVEGGLGVSIVSLMTLDHELKQGSLRALRIVRFPIYRSISFVFPRGVEQTAVVKDMVSMCGEYGKKISAARGKRTKKS